MNRRNLVTVLAVLLLAVISVCAIFFPFGRESGEGSQIRYPQTTEEESGPTVDIIEENRRIVEAVTIGPPNIQSALAMLRRPEEYSATYSIAYYLVGVTVPRQMTVQLWVTPEMQKVYQQFATTGEHKHTVLTQEAIYIWEDDGSVEYSGKPGSFTVDDTGHIMTHELLLNLDPEAITRGSLERTAEGEACLLLEALNPLSGYREVYTVLVNTGLLTSCAIYDGERLIYEMNQTSLSLDPIDREVVFTLPNGNLPVTEQDPTDGGDR